MYLVFKDACQISFPNSVIDSMVSFTVHLIIGGHRFIVC